MPTKEEIAQNNELWEQYRTQHGLAATLEAHAQQYSERNNAKLRAEFAAEMGRRDFWQNFYHRNPDLQQDRKFVSETLDANLKDLSDVPVDDAYDRLADLVRNDLATGDKRRRDQKEYSMYSGGPGVPDGVRATPPSGQNSKTLGDIIRARSEKRRNGIQREYDDDFNPTRHPAG